MPVAVSDTVLRIDGAILLFIQNNLRSPALTAFCQSISDHNVFVPVIAIYVLCLLLWEKRKIFPIASACIVSVLLGHNMENYLKKLVKRPRPFLEIPSLEPLLTKLPKSFSFPSGHTTLAFALAFILYRILPKRYSIPVFCMAALMAFSLIYLGKHYPTDILGGICVGYVAARITEFSYKR